jgi:peroxiredoxin
MKKEFSIVLLSMALCAFVAWKTSGLAVNDRAPDFTSIDQNGKPIHLKDQLKKTVVVLIFYRGEWCPFCNKQLKQLEDSLALITAKGATVIAVTPEKKENVSKTIGKTKATFSILTDDSLKIMKAYKVAYTPDDATSQKLKGYGIDLAERNGNNGNNLLVPAVYIVNKEDKIIYRFFDANYKNRASVKEILSHL